MQMIRCGHGEWYNATEDTTKKLNNKVKEPQLLLFFKGAIYEFTHNKDNSYSQGQMALLFELPSQIALNNGQAIKVLAAPTGLHDIEYDETKTKEEYIEDRFYEVKIKICQGGNHAIGSHLQGNRKQYDLKHRVT